MRNRLGTLVFLGLGTALFGSACDGPTACQSAATRISDTCGGDAAFAAFGEADRAGFESACGTANTACQTCIDALLTSAAGCTNLASCVDECVCPPGTICGVGDAGQDGAAPADTGPMPDTGPVACSPAPMTGSAPGAACRMQTTCTRDACNQEIMLTGGVAVFAGSMCGDECDPNATTNECGECGTCSDSTYLGRFRIPELSLDASGTSIVILPGVCRSQCTPNAATNGGCRTGYTCDVDRGVCVDQQCATDAHCQIVFTETGIGSDPTVPWTCDTARGVCTHPGTPAAAAGDACTGDAECMEDGTCLTGDDIPDGFCTRIGCNAAGFECGTGETCSLRGAGGPSLCLPECAVGEEPEADRLGVGGHGAGCDAGQSCIWNGQDETSTAGGCLPGNYNDITTPNVGGACQTSADCYSPFGYGQCLFETQTSVGSGMCGIGNCSTFMNSAGATVDGILPAVETTTRVCDSDAGELCVGFAGGDTFCLLGCDSAMECAPGYACPALLTGGGRLCWPQCFAAGDCRTGATCEQVDPDTGASTGPCDFDGPDNIANSGDEPDCFCSDRTPRPMDDGGTPTPDGGSTTDGGSSTIDGGSVDAGVDGG